MALALHASTPLNLDDTFFISGGRKLEENDAVRSSHLTAYSTVSVNFRKRGGSSPSHGMPSSEDLSDHDSDDGLVENEGVIFSPAVRTPPDTPRVVPGSMARRRDACLCSRHLSRHSRPKVFKNNSLFTGRLYDYRGRFGAKCVI